MKVKQNNLKELGAHLKAKREESGITMYTMLMNHRIQQNTVNAIETGGNYTMKSFLRYCEVIGVEIDIEAK